MRHSKKLKAHNSCELHTKRINFSSFCMSRRWHIHTRDELASIRALLSDARLRPARRSSALAASVVFALCSNAPLVLMHPCTLESELFSFFALTPEKQSADGDLISRAGERPTAADALSSVINIRACDRHRPGSDCQPPAALLARSETINARTSHLVKITNCCWVVTSRWH